MQDKRRFCNLLERRSILVRLRVAILIMPQRSYISRPGASFHGKSNARTHAPNWCPNSDG